MTRKRKTKDLSRSFFQAFSYFFISLLILSFLIPVLIIGMLYIFIYYRKPRIYKRVKRSLKKLRPHKKLRFLKTWNYKRQIAITCVIFLLVNWISVGRNSNNPLRFVYIGSLRPRIEAVFYLGIYYVSYIFIRHRHSDLPDIIASASSKYEVDRNLIYGIIEIESSFRIIIISHKGACGLMQLMPRTAQGMKIFNIFAPKHNIYGGTRYIKELLDRFNGNLKLAIVAYNWGPSHMEKRGASYDWEMNDYYTKIIRARNRYARKGR